MSFDQQLEIVKHREGFIAALDQSGGSTPKALQNYGITSDEWSNEEEMFSLVHKMRERNSSFMQFWIRISNQIKLIVLDQFQLF